jgi:hypothetical protein
MCCIGLSAYVAMVQLNYVSARLLAYRPTWPWFNWTTFMLGRVSTGRHFIDSDNSITTTIGSDPIALQNQLSKAPSKTHFQLVRRWSLRYKLVFTTCPKNVILGSGKLLSAFKNHSLNVLRATSLKRGLVVSACFPRANFITQLQFTPGAVE